MNIQALLFSFIAGMSTLIGVIFIFLGKNAKKYINLFLAFSAGVMIGVSIFDLIPTSFHLLNQYSSFIEIIIMSIFIIIGIIISNYINEYVLKHHSTKNNLYQLGIISMLTIILHNLPEGILTYVGTSYDSRLGLSLVIAIALHNIPEGISIAMPIYCSTGSKFKAIFYTLISGLSEPLGAIIAYFIFGWINNLIIGFISAIVAGIMINIAITELLKEALKFKKIYSILILIVGFLFIANVCLILD